jgi:hypothetical protein
MISRIKKGKPFFTGRMQSLPPIRQSQFKTAHKFYDSSQDIVIEKLSAEFRKSKQATAHAESPGVSE